MQNRNNSSYLFKFLKIYINKKKLLSSVGTENKLLVDRRRAFASYDYGQKCTFGCLPCFDNGIDVVRFTSIKEAESAIMKSIDDIDILHPGCEQELFIDQKLGLEYVRFLSKFGKIVTLATRAHLNYKTIQGLSEINTNLREMDNNLVVFVSFISGKDYHWIEPNAPSVESRINTLEQLAAEDIPASAYIRPILPESIVPIENILELVDKTHPMVSCYTAGAFFYNDHILHKMKLTPDVIMQLENDSIIVNPSWLSTNEKTLMKRYVNHNVRAEIASLTLHYGVPTFYSSIDAIKYINNKNVQDRNG